MTRVTVVGAGSWGTALANLLAGEGHDVSIWAYEPAVAASINEQNVNEDFLSGCPLAPSLRASSDMQEALEGVEVVVSAVPSHAVRTISGQVASALNNADPRPLVVSVSKGLEEESLKMMSNVLEETLPDTPIAALSGPSFAREVYQRHPTAVVVACRDHDAAATAQELFRSGYFRVYTSTDVVGVQLGGALKNVIAIAAGLLHGLELGHNSLAALVTRGLAETTRLGVTMGADPMTFAGLAGIGDLLLTATGGLSRNRTLGIELARGRTLDEIMAERNTVAEGVLTARAAVELAQREGTELPIATEVSKILFDGKDPALAVRDLMEREPKPERWQ